MGLFGFGKKNKGPSVAPTRHDIVEGSEDKYDEYEDFYGSEPDDGYSPFVVDEYGFDFPGYDEVYDEFGGYVPCDGYRCNAKVMYHDGRYECPKCGKIFDRQDFFNYIGANPPGPKCVTCDNLYPGCIVCPHGYIKDEF